MAHFLKLRVVLGSLLLVGFGLLPPVARADQATVKALKVTILSTMLADGAELGEWGFAALVEVDGHRILFDTGAHRDVVLKNVESLGLDLTTVPEVILSHSHWDHIGGLALLRDSVVKAGFPKALARVHVGEGIFYPRLAAGPAREANPILFLKSEYEATGGVFVEHGQPVELFPGVWLTGPIPRKYPERNWSGHDQLKGPQGVVEDNVPEDSALVIATDEGLVVLTGCGHAGVVNTLEFARQVAGAQPVLALIGGIHLFNAKDESLAWTAGKLKEFGVKRLIGAHCTGIETVYRLRSALGLQRGEAVVGAVGASFELGRGIDPRHIAQ